MCTVRLDGFKEGSKRAILAKNEIFKWAAAELLEMTGVNKLSNLRYSKKNTKKFSCQGEEDLN